jgi:glycosyltransferase involved in cell wall biosynthesis
MKLLHLTPGTGSFHCGSCLRDNALIKAMRARGHDALMIPLYLPLVTDKDEANPEQSVRVGGVSLYLQERFPKLFRWVPEPLRQLLDSEACLRWASGFMGMTSARDLGEMTVGSLLGENGRQWVEWEKLVSWIEADAKPDVISLSNSLLIGLAPALARRLDVPIVCSLQGEDAFLDALTEPYRTKAWGLMRENARSVSLFISPSQFYADTMAPRLGLGPDKMTVLYNGLDFSQFDLARTEPAVPTVGFLARMIHGKGLTTLVEAFIKLASSHRVEGVNLRVAGAKTSSDGPYLQQLQTRLEEAGLAERVSFEPNLTFEEKVKFLHEVTIFSVPTTSGEAFGLYIAEAQGCGLPVVQPRHGAFPEILDITQGGVLCEPDDAESLSRALGDLLLDSPRRLEMARKGRENARLVFSASKMAETFEKVLKSLI